MFNIHNIAVWKTLKQIAVQNMSQNLCGIWRLALEPHAQILVGFLPFQSFQQKREVRRIQCLSGQKGIYNVVDAVVFLIHAAILIVQDQHGSLCQALCDQKVAWAKGLVSLNDQEPAPIQRSVPQIHIYTPLRLRLMAGDPEFGSSVGIGFQIVGVVLERINEFSGNESLRGRGYILRGHNLRQIIGHSRDDKPVVMNTDRIAQE